LFHTDWIDYLYQDPHLDNKNFNDERKGNNPGNYIGVLKHYSSSNSRVFGSVTLKNSTVNYSASKNFPLFSGVIVSIENLTIDNVEVNYSGTSKVGANFGYIGIRNSSNFWSTNTIKNCIINRALATGATKINGSNKSVKIIDSKDNSGLPNTIL